MWLQKTSFFLVITCLGLQPATGDVDETIQDLSDQIRLMQVQRSTTTANPPFSYYKDKGMYESDVKMYFHGDSEMHMLRDSMSVFDNNMFATCWITIGLLEAHKYGKAPRPSSKQMQLALEAISMYTDRNRNYVNSVMNFWPQVYNRTAYAWQSTPQNLVAVLESTFGKNWGLIEKILEAFGQTELEDIIKFILGTREGYLTVFRIPPDFDDSFVNIGLGSILKEMSDKFPEAYAQWAKTNSNLTSVLDAVKKYAYRPMSNDSRVNTIDPRTYFHVRKFLMNASMNNEDIALVSTWAQDLQEVRTAFYKGVAMPLNINNVDCTVAANTIYGITNGILSGLLKESVLDDPEIQQIYRNTSHLIAFEIDTGFTDHKDLALTYYPSEYEFYWFVARTYTQIQSYTKKKKIHPVMQEIKDLFGQVLKGKVTQLITDSYKIEIDDRIYWDDFLGNGDKNSNNQTMERGEDRIFTTAMAINTLMTIWTVHDDVRDRLIWEQDTPFKVFETVKQGVNWLDIQALGGEFKPWNAFFSGSLKGFINIERTEKINLGKAKAAKSKTENDGKFVVIGLPFMSSNPLCYPKNVYEYLNGTTINRTETLRTMAYTLGIQGIPAEEWYENEFKTPCYGQTVPKVFPGYNNDPSFWPFWTSEPYTYTISMLAMSKYRNAVIG